MLFVCVCVRVGVPNKNNKHSSRLNPGVPVTFTFTSITRAKSGAQASSVSLLRWCSKLRVWNMELRKTWTVTDIFIHNNRRALVQNAISVSPQNVLAVPMLSSKIVFWKRTLHIFIYLYGYTYLWRAFIQTMISKLDIGIANSIFGLALMAVLEKELFSCE